MQEEKQAAAVKAAAEKTAIAAARIENSKRVAEAEAEAAKKMAAEKEALS